MAKTDKDGAKKPAPRFMYKYRSWSEPEHKTILTERKLWFTSPRWFNDPFDCRIPFRFDKLTLADHKENAIRAQADFGENKTPAEIQQYAEELAAFWANVSDSDRKKIYIEAQKWLCDNRGLFTMSGISGNILMWSHYSDAHKGFCVELDTHKLGPWLRLSPTTHKDNMTFHSVEYEDKYPVLIPTQSNPRDYFRNLIVKSSQWSYEEEYRIISYGRSDFGVKIDPGLITKVILGCEISDTHREEIIHELIKLGDHITLVQAKVKDGQFGLDFEEVAY